MGFLNQCIKRKRPGWSDTIVIKGNVWFCPAFCARTSNYRVFFCSLIAASDASHPRRCEPFWKFVQRDKFMGSEQLLLLCWDGYHHYRLLHSRTATHIQFLLILLQISAKNIETGLWWEVLIIASFTLVQGVWPVWVGDLLKNIQTNKPSLIFPS